MNAASPQDVPGSPPEWALAERAGSLGPYTPGSPFLPSLPAGGRAVSQPLLPQVNNYLPAGQGWSWPASGLGDSVVWDGGKWANAVIHKQVNVG